MLTQAELFSNGEFTTRWIEHNPHEQPLTVGRKLGLMEEPSKVWIIGRLFASVGEARQLPPKAISSTILSFLEGDGAVELAAVYPKIYVV